MTLEKIVDVLTRRPWLNGTLAALIDVPRWIHDNVILPLNNVDHKEFFEKMVDTIPIGALYFGTALATGILRSFVVGQSAGAVRPHHYKIVKELEKECDALVPPTLNAHREQPVTFNFLDFYKSCTQQDNPSTASIQALRRAIRKDRQELFSALIATTQTTYQKKPKLGFLSRASLFPFDFALPLARKLHPHEPEIYAVCAAYSALVKPERTWYWTTLGINVAEQFKPEWTPDMRVIHALFASAQNRSDADEAWSSAFSELGHSEWKRLGDSRNVVKVYNGSTFIKDTIVFKENTSRDALEYEAATTKKLADSVKTIDVAQPLYITSAPNDNGKHIYALRFAHGETLHDQLLRGDKTNVALVVDALADVHCFMPTDGMQRLDLEKRLASRLAIFELELPPALANALDQAYQYLCTLLRQDAQWVWCKDAHSLNWILGKRVVAIDCEADYTIPAGVDLATLLIHDRCFSDEEKLDYLARYATRMAAQGKPLNLDTATFDYNNAELYRFASFLSAWSLREGMREKRSPLIDDALHTLERQKKEPLYRQHKDVYESLAFHLPQASIHIDAIVNSL